MAGLLVIGAGGHGKVVADCASLSGRWDAISFVDRVPHGASDGVGGWATVATDGNAHLLRDRFEEFVVCVGDGANRCRLMRQYRAWAFLPATVVHPMAAVSRLAAIGEGGVVLAMAVVNAGAELGAGCIVNTGALVDHDCVLGECVHIAPGAALAGGVRVGARSVVGVGAAVRPGVHIGSDVVVGVGAAVVSDVSDGATVVGVPASPFSRR